VFVTLPLGIHPWNAAIETQSQLSEHFIDEALHVCEAAARAGGQELLAFRGRFQTREKGRADLVTDADESSQEAIRRLILAKFPDHAFVGEEHSLDKPPTGSSDFTWVADPLDGTTNYVHGYPQYGVSLALVRGNELLVGVVYDPVGDVCFSAASGRGAWCDSVAMKTSAIGNVHGSLVAVSLPAHVQRDSRDLLDFVEAAQACQAVRRSGSAALNFAYVAKGALDAFWASHIHPWDVAAGVLLVREAGGVVTARDGGEFDLWKPNFLAAANAELHAGLLNVLAR